jgi:tRNA pseudouridine55 synthase
VLVLGVGRATRLLHFLVGVDKQYRATIRLGVSTTTDDADGDVLSRHDATGVHPAALAAAMAALTGAIDQVPSAVSAVKVDGKAAHRRVRAGEPVVLAARPVHVTAFDLHDRRDGPDGPDGPAVVDLDVSVDCSAGTYVRALARDLGAALGVGGHVLTLRRTRVGPFALDQATALDDVPPGLDAVLLPAEQAVRQFLPTRVLDDAAAAGVTHGVAPAATGTAGPVALLDETGRLLAVAEDRGPRAALSAVLVG